MIRAFTINPTTLDLLLLMSPGGVVIFLDSNRAVLAIFISILKFPNHFKTINMLGFCINQSRGQ